MATGDQYPKSGTLSTSSTSAQAIGVVGSGFKRISFSITNTSALAVVNVSKGDIPAIAGHGWQLTPNGVVSESTDSGMRCWQGSVQVVSDVAGSVAFTEVLEEL